ncbi:hypothetical protein F2Q69_00004704 [Brassica cretica]|uniref:Uncharacterized protein n=1 Tax=Brassica cretica TaxID=69181 RepID=A0A8S9P8R0_BRACR|nr:hypothetical protein F2Q69_00004704 [Brassica cretica]
MTRHQFELPGLDTCPLNDMGLSSFESPKTRNDLLRSLNTDNGVSGIWVTWIDAKNLYVGVLSRSLVSSSNQQKRSELLQIHRLYVSNPADPLRGNYPPRPPLIWRTLDHALKSGGCIEAEDAAAVLSQFLSPFLYAKMCVGDKECHRDLRKVMHDYVNKSSKESLLPFDMLLTTYDIALVDQHFVSQIP